MLQNDRHRQILTILAEQSSVQIAELCRLFDVSEMTVHRDLNQLEAQGRLRKVRGGAVLAASTDPDAACCFCLIAHPSSRPMVLHLDDGTHRQTCCAHCGLMALFEPDVSVSSALVTDFLYGRTVNCRTAVYVVAPVIRLCCTPTVLAFERRDEAERFRKGFGGQVLDLEEAMDFLRHEMALEFGKT
jgi:hypothetical protein